MQYKKIISLVGIAFIIAVTNCNAALKTIALTFDDGPSAIYTQEVLDLLKKYDAKATFFVTGGSVAAHPQGLKNIYAAGHQIGNHSYTHPLASRISPTAFKNELVKTNELIYKTIHVYPRFYRPPFGMSTERTNKIVAELGLKKVTWDFLVNDYFINKTTAEKIASQVIKHAAPGAIITMHDGGGDRSKTVKALATILPTLKKQGYEFVTVAEIYNAKPYREKANES